MKNNHFQTPEHPLRLKAEQELCACSHAFTPQLMYHDY
jgi:hypothetical protein